MVAALATMAISAGTGILTNALNKRKQRNQERTAAKREAKVSQASAQSPMAMSTLTA